MTNPSPIRCTIYDPIHVEIFNRISKRRKYKKSTRTVRELALERAKQIDDFGDIPLVPVNGRASH